ncbi:histidine--tRNA ligase [Candidatus Micrarchaeota archaeon CG10_big_fil_rev_8_21_14_0_10_45_29]|nr:MAG: histidine--tRNA ligase [Candidatus Micrarchaeota archaeon CG10_big_fil_rev_8_21_14_0_10_45_29]
MANFETPKGMKDFGGEDAIYRERMLESIKQVYKKWGYEPLSTPAIENVKTLCAKSGDEIAGQLFRIEKSELALRFDQTVGLARYVAGANMAKPYKRYIIANAWRREEPQKGRMREFLQADADIVGSADMRCEAELLAMSCEALQTLGFGEFEILLNNRKILNGIIKSLKIENAENAILRALDKLGKIGIEGVKKEIEACKVKRADIEQLLQVLMPGKKENEKALELAKKYSQEGAGELENILCILKYAYGIENVKVDLSLVRGLGYYTGPIFEISAGGGIGSVAGGGRYDELAGVYGKKEPAVGISLGVERLFALKKGKGEKISPCDVMIITFDDKSYGGAVRAAKRIREAGFSCRTDLMGRKVKNQLEYANACKIPFALIIGEKEMKSGKFALKDLKSGKQKEIGIEEVLENLEEAREIREGL